MTSPTATRSGSRRWLALALLCTVQFMVVLDVSVVNLALPPYGRSSASRRRGCSG